MEALVPTGMKAGVSKEPCGVWTAPRRALVSALVALISKVIADMGEMIADQMKREIRVGGRVADIPHATVFVS